MRTAFAVGLVVALAACAPTHQDIAPPSGGSPTTASAPASSSPPTVGNTPLPPAADGTNLDSCRAGRCQVLVTLPAVLTVESQRLPITLEGNHLMVKPNGQALGMFFTLESPGDHISFSSPTTTGGKEITVSLVGIRGNTAELTVTSE